MSMISLLPHLFHHLIIFRERGSASFRSHFCAWYSTGLPSYSMGQHLRPPSDSLQCLPQSPPRLPLIVNGR